MGLESEIRDREKFIPGPGSSSQKGTQSRRVGKNPGFFKKNQPGGFFWDFLGFFVCRACLHSFFIDCQSARELRITSIPRDAVI
jgi:hypothetical protein